MRIIGGSARSIPLRVPKGEVRPTSDRVREAAFSLLGGLIEGARCLDLYAGSGALGIEALSRGAASCVFVDQARASCDAVGENLAKAKLAVAATVRCMDAERYLRTATGTFDLVFADPPYSKPGRPDLAAALVGSDELIAALAPGAMVLLETAKGAGKTPHHARLELLDTRQYGETQLAFFRRVDD